jgi:mRNA interferase RelE/StbE
MTLRVNDLDNLHSRRESNTMATVELTREAAEQAERLPKKVHDRVLALVRRLERWPDVSGVKRLSGNLAGWCRLRTGDYRIRFRVQGDRIVVDKIGHRREFYED